jgi:hypothetical protein
MTLDPPRFLRGLNIMSHQLAREVRDEFRVERNHREKRRHNWRVVRHHIDRPGIIIANGVVYMHPDLVAKLLRKKPTP